MEEKLYQHRDNEEILYVESMTEEEVLDLRNFWKGESNSLDPRLIEIPRTRELDRSRRRHQVRLSDLQTLFLEQCEDLPGIVIDEALERLPEFQFFVEMKLKKEEEK